MYQTMKTTSLSKMILFSDFVVVEKLSEDVVKYNLLQLKIDHLKSIVQFGNEVKKFNLVVFIILNVNLIFPFEDDASVHGVFFRVSKLLGNLFV